MQFLSFHFAIPKDVKNWKSCVCFYVVLELRIWKRKFSFLEFFFLLNDQLGKSESNQEIPALGICSKVLLHSDWFTGLFAESVHCVDWIQVDRSTFIH